MSGVELAVDHFSSRLHVVDVRKRNMKLKKSSRVTVNCIAKMFITVTAGLLLPRGALKMLNKSLDKSCIKDRCICQRRRERSRNTRLIRPRWRKCILAILQGKEVKQLLRRICNRIVARRSKSPHPLLRLHLFKLQPSFPQRRQEILRPRKRLCISHICDDTSRLAQRNLNNSPRNNIHGRPTRRLLQLWQRANRQRRLHDERNRLGIIPDPTSSVCYDLTDTKNSRSHSSSLGSCHAYMLCHALTLRVPHVLRPFEFR